MLLLLLLLLFKYADVLARVPEVVDAGCPDIISLAGESDSELANPLWFLFVAFELLREVKLLARSVFICWWCPVVTSD